ncbi:MAG TPA: hypothetical protein VFE62_24390 [Gemmataceae bacterium]|nr:hypothetical protein [Gemmataceae bacterium]
MTIIVERETKIRTAKSGPVRTFGDYDKRRDMNDEQLVALFDRAWRAGLEHAIVHLSLPCDYNVASARLKERQREFLHSDEEHRQFRYQEMEFIVQLRPAEKTSKELTQLWKVQSGDDYPKTIFVTFGTVEERQRFRDIASRLGWHDEELALSLLRDFMAKFDVLVPSKKTPEE